MYTELLRSRSLNTFYNNLIKIWGGLDYVGISDGHLSFRYINNICIIDKELEFLDLDNINEPICINPKHLKSNYVKSFFLPKNFILEINKINWFDNPSVRETLINANNHILIDLSEFIKINMSLNDFKYCSILLLNDKINKFELMKKIYNIYPDHYNLEKFIKTLYKYRNNETSLNYCIENYNDALILANYRLNNH